MNTVRSQIEHVYDQVLHFLNESQRGSSDAVEFKCNKLALMVIMQAKDLVVREEPTEFSVDFPTEESLTVSYRNGPGPLKTTISDMRAKTFRILSSLQNSWTEGKKSQGFPTYNKIEEYLFEFNFFNGLIEKLEYQGFLELQSATIQMQRNEESFKQMLIYGNEIVLKEFFDTMKWELSHIKAEKQINKKKAETPKRKKGCTLC